MTPKFPTHPKIHLPKGTWHIVTFDDGYPLAVLEDERGFGRGYMPVEDAVALGLVEPPSIS